MTIACLWRMVPQVLGLRHLAECVHDPETHHAHLDSLDGSVHTFRILASTGCSMVMALQ